MSVLHKGCPNVSSLLLLHGPNLNLLGQRQVDWYGDTSLATINTQAYARANALNHTLTIEQHNAEGALIEAIHQHAAKHHLLILNAAAYTHTSIALRDALLGTQLPFIEVHISNIYAREPFRQRSYLADIACASLTGFGPMGYLLAIEGAHALIHNNPQHMLHQ